jgi:hypothetical protein
LEAIALLRGSQEDSLLKVRLKEPPNLNASCKSTVASAGSQSNKFLIPAIILDLTLVLGLYIFLLNMLFKFIIVDFITRGLTSERID